MIKDLSKQQRRFLSSLRADNETPLSIINGLGIRYGWFFKWLNNPIFKKAYTTIMTGEPLEKEYVLREVEEELLEDYFKEAEELKSLARATNRRTKDIKRFIREN